MRPWHSVSVVSLAIAVALGASGSQQAEAKILAQWVQLGPDGSASVRAISDDTCPSVTFDGTSVVMSVRSEPKQAFANVPPAQFPVRGCEVAVPAGVVAATLDGKALPLARPNPQRIVMFGDTGCRLKVGDPWQACNDTNAWPFPKVAAAAAAARPDLVIHVGDYEYREDPCPAGNAGCAGSPAGYGWEPWNADFFQPAAPLFAGAPWIMVRGNHEDCKDRAGEGWFRFLDWQPMQQSCRDLTGDYVVRLGDFAVVVVDSAKISDAAGTDSEQVAIVRGQLVDVLGKIPDYAWLATHKPVDAVLAKPGDPSVNIVSNKVLQAALGADMPASVRMYVAGHIHFFQALDFGGARPAQLVVGTGGDNLEGKWVNATGADINGMKAVNATTESRFGYMVWDRLSRDTWSGTLFDVDGKPVDRCRLSDRSLSCGS